MRILFSTWDYHPSAAGGAEKQARLQAEELVRRGHAVEVMCPRTAGHKRGYETGGVRVHRLFRIERRPFQRLTYLVAMSWFLLRNLRRFDLVHVHLANLQADVVVAFCRLLGRPSYVKLASGGYSGEIGRLGRAARFTRWYGLRHATRVQALSEELEAELRGIGVTGDRVVRIPNGMDFAGYDAADDALRRSRRTELGLPRDKQLVLFVGRFSRYKGVEDLLAAWRRLERDDAVLVMVGATETTDDPIHEIPRDRGVITRGWQADVRPYLQAADIFVSPSHADGMSNALLEAMASGLAIVATSVGAAEEMLAAGTAGLLAPPQAPDRLVEAIGALLDDPRRRRALGEAARAEVQRYALPRIVGRIEDVYGQIAGR